MRPFWFSKELLRGQRKACRCWQPSCHQEEESLFKNGANTEKAKEGSIRTRGSMLYNRQCHAAQSLAPPGTGGLLPDSRAQGSIFNSICPRRSRLCLKTSASHFSACFPQQCLQLMLSPSPPAPGPPPRPLSYTHPLSLSPTTRVRADWRRQCLARRWEFQASWRINGRDAFERVKSTCHKHTCPLHPP